VFPLNLYARVHFLLCISHTRPRVQRAPGLPCALYLLGGSEVDATLGHVMPREGSCMSYSCHRPRKRAIQYAAASRLKPRRLWNTGSPAFAGDDEKKAASDLNLKSHHVIARSGSDEAIHVATSGEMDCFASLAMTVIVYAAFACTLSQNSASRSASRSVAGLASGDATSATSVRSIGAKPSLAVSTR
jgi:hypothetical protein